MITQFTPIIAKKLNLKDFQVKNTLELLDDDCTIPFIARYRKEKTDSLDEVSLIEIQKEFERLKALEERRTSILESIKKQEKLTPELEKQILEAKTLTELEDLYLPYKPKKRTRAQIAKENGLEPLAEIIFKQENSTDITREALCYLNENIDSPEKALEGAKDIIAEWISEDQENRSLVREVFTKESRIASEVIKKKENEEKAQKYRDYFSFSEDLKRCSSHRLLAIRRGEEEGFLRVRIEINNEETLEELDSLIVQNNNASSGLVAESLQDSFKRLILPSIETEFAKSSKEKADEEAIRVFAENLRQLLLGSPLGPKKTLAIDPGFRTGCKVACLNEQGDILEHTTIYPTPPIEDKVKAGATVMQLVSKYQTEAIAIGNGTASRETEQFIRDLKLPDIDIFVVSEDGASIYSASEVAREEFPSLDATVRGSISIGRRLMDPLAELVKIDPKSIGVGQYQHDVDQKKLKNSLDQIVESCVNKVGVNINTASKELLTYVSGLTPTLAKNIVLHRAENGPFKSRTEIKKVSRLGPKAFEQSAAFLRIPNGKNPLDNSAVHPESYVIVKQMAKDLGVKEKELLEEGSLRNKIEPKEYVTETVGLPTLEDILKELEKPGRDPREPLETFSFSEEVRSIDDLKEGMLLPGIITNITNFGAFVNIGVKQDGLVHISQMADKFVSDPNEIVKLHEQVEVKVVEIDKERGRIALSMRK